MNKAINGEIKSWIKFHLQEAQEEIQKTFQELNDDTEFSEPDLQISFSHIYNHLNTAWNSRNASVQEIEKHKESDFEKWRLFPHDLDMSC